MTILLVIIWFVIDLVPKDDAVREERTPTQLIIRIMAGIKSVAPCSWATVVLLLCFHFNVCYLRLALLPVLFPYP